MKPQYQPTNADIARTLVRIETRLVRLVEFLGAADYVGTPTSRTGPVPDVDPRQRELPLDTPTSTTTI